MKSTPLIFQDFSIAGLRKQWEYQQYQAGKLPASTEFYTINGFDAIGCKTETRRTRGLDKINENPNEWEFKGFGDTTSSKVFKFPLSAETSYAAFRNKITGEFEPSLIKPPYGVVGSEIWVKETYIELAGSFPNAGGYAYKADGVNTIEKWKSPLFMPKAASRIKLEITGISIERLHDITEEGALREGIIGTRLPAALGGGMAYNIKGKYISALDIEDSATGAYKWIWINMHGQESWNKSPWVWVIKFTVKEFKL